MRHLSLFTGSGIGDHAAELCGIETVAQCEIDPCCMYCLEHLFPKALKFKYVHDVSAKSLGSVLPIDIISGGFPCQNLSTAGRGEGIEGSRSGLWREMFRVIRQVRPAWLVIENVPAIRLRGVDRVIALLERIGYTCWPLVVGAWAVGAPHKRDRVWIVANRPRQRGQQRAERDRVGVCCGRRLEDSAEARRTRTRQIQTNNERSDSDARWRFRISKPCNAGEDFTDSAVADADQERRKKHPSVSGDDGTQFSSAIGRRWPSSPGQPQHEWEPPRLAQFGVGDATDGMAGRVRSRTNKALLRMAGNGWCFPNALLIYQWIVMMEAQHGRNAGGTDS